ncbi:MAG: 5'/3'-nucleotidase SurE [Pseudomonadota bacterium]
MTKPRILLTNDDSHDSPLFHIAIDALSSIGELSIAVPATEQSWKGKSMSRHDPVYVDEINVHGLPAWSITGTPADCANLAIHELMDTPPDVVVSGINIGKNIGLGFVYASGTIGACIEANIAGLPGLALSQELTPEDFRHWDAEREFPAATTALLQAEVGHMVKRVWEHLNPHEISAPITWNVNFPTLPVKGDAEVVRTRLGFSTYGSCFTRRGDQYHFGLAEAQIDDTPMTDDQTLKAGSISATLLDIKDFGQNLA